MTEKRIQEVKAMFTEGNGFARSSELRRYGVCSKDIRELAEQNCIVHLKDGYYCWADRIDQISDYQIAVYTVPDAVICGLSAASLHGMTSVIPESIHIAVPNKGRLPALPDYPAIAVVRSKMEIYQIGITELDGLPIYDRERTVCDCIKASDKVGKDVALEVLRIYMKGKRDIQRLYDYAERLRIVTRIQPYMEVLL